MHGSRVGFSAANFYCWRPVTLSAVDLPSQLLPIDAPQELSNNEANPTDLNRRLEQSLIQTMRSIRWGDRPAVFNHSLLLKARFLLPLVAFVACLGIALSANAAALFDQGSIWRWRPGSSEASNPVTGWRLYGFDDSEFVSAPAPFWYDSSGDSSTLVGGTKISGMQSAYNSIFLRKTFIITNAANITGLRFGALVDDGFVAWINGREGVRVNMPGAPGDPVSITTPASNAAEPVMFALHEISPASDYLQDGTNVVAVQVFQSSIASSDFDFDASLESVEVDSIPPRITMVSPAAGELTNLTQITVSFTEPVIGVTAGHLLVAGVPATDVSAVNASTYTYTFSQPTPGAVPITWSASQTIDDLAIPPNAFDENAPGATWTYTLVDVVPPVIASFTPSAGTVRALTNITVIFSEPVTGVDAADLLINNIPVSSVTVDGPSQYTFKFPQPVSGALQVTWASGNGIADLAAKPNAFLGNNWVYLLDPNAREPLPYISEFMASNSRTLADENGQFPDWIEIYNPSPVTVNLDGWSLTDSASNPGKWKFPPTNLAGGNFMIVFASGNNRRAPGSALHTSFSLSGDGEYLGLVKPDGKIASEFRPTFASQVPDVSYGLAHFGSPPFYTSGTNGVYFTAASPGSANLGGATAPGPIIEAVSHTPTVPQEDEDLVVTARVLPSFSAVVSVTLRYRIMFDPEVAIPMLDDGAHGDGLAGDGIFGATIPASASTSGQMIRYMVAATDVRAHASRWPLFTTSTGSAEYLGTIVSPAGLTSQLPIFHLFVAPGQLAGIDSEGGGRLSFFYDREFYDNIYMELRGNTSAGYRKKSHRLEFNSEHKLRHPGPGGRVRKTSLLAEYVDPSYLRQHLSFWFLNNIGVPAPFDYPVRVQMNGQFYQLAFHNEVIGQEQMERMGYDPAGALYKAVGVFKPDFYSTGVFQKLEPDNDPSRTDYLQLANGFNESSSTTTRRNTVFDQLDLPEVINHLAGTRWCSENDDVWANMSMYRDTFGDGLWRNVPFDMNASWGQLYGGSNPLQATVDGCKSHPLYGGSAIGSCDGPGAPNSFNRLYDVIIALPETRQMLLRRMRSIMDEWVQPPGTPAESLIIENHIKQMTNLIAIEAELDRAKWGAAPWAPTKTFAAGVGDLITQFVGPRRRHWFVTHSITNTSRPLGITPSSNAGIPNSQPANATVSIINVEFNPVSGRQDEEYVCLTNSWPLALDISGWKLDGAVQFTFASGTIVPSNNVIYVSPNTRAFRARAVSPRGSQGLFAVGPSKGQLSARGETLRVLNPRGQTMNSFTYAGAPSLAQRFLRVTELMYHPSAFPGSPFNAEEFEFIELKNISTNVTLNLNGVRLTNGVSFNFSGSAVTNLMPGATALVVRNLNAFRARYGIALNVAGQYTGALDNDGARIQLLDVSNEEILDFSYNNSWFPITDGFGFSIVVINENAPPDDWDRKSNWRPSGQLLGSPDATDLKPPPLPPILINEILTRSDTPPPTDSVELYNPTTNKVNIGGWFLSDDFNTPKKFRIPDGTTIEPLSYLIFSEADFNPGGSGFAFGSDGDEAWLFSGDANTNLTGYFHGSGFGATENGVSFGRHITSDGEEHFVAQTALTLGEANSAPLVGPVVISEVVYHPLDFADGSNNASDEFIELLNITSNAVALFDPLIPRNTWKLTGGIDFTFPTNTTFEARETLLVVNFDPTNIVAADAFRAKQGISPGVPLFGPFTGHLNNGGDNVELKKPTTPLAGIVPYVLVDKVNFKDSSPWPLGADGLGLSLQRRDTHGYGNDPANWFAAPPSPGWLFDLPDLDADWDGDGALNWEEYLAGTNPIDPESHLTINFLSVNGLATLSFEAVSNRTYTVEYSEALGNGLWSKFIDMPARSSNHVELISGITFSTNRFYRVTSPQRP
jgi:hypothetical protein